jgi:hypothetical protein
MIIIIITSFSFSDYPSAQLLNGKSKGSVGLAGPGVHRAIWQLFFALIVQVALVTFTIGVKVPSGLIIPSMSIGAITGRIIGIITEQLAIQNPSFILFRRDCSKGSCCSFFSSEKIISKVSFQRKIVLHQLYMLLLVHVHFWVVLVK